MTRFRSPSFRFLAFGAALVAGLALTSMAVARGHGHDKGGRHGGGLAHVERAVERLELDAASRERVFAILDASRAEAREFRREMREARGELRSLLDAETPDAAAVFAQVDVVGALRTEAQKQKLRTLLEVRSVLTPEQWQELSRFRKGPKHRRGPHGSDAGPKRTQ